jgi:hypothetical protein
MQKELYIFGLFIIALTTSCIKSGNEPTDPIIGNVDLYLIDNYSTVGNTCEIDESTITIEENPIINYSEFIYYKPDLFEFKISDSAVVRIESLNYSTLRIPFVVMADDSIVYSGYFISGLSSTTCNWTVINPTILSGNHVLRVNLGYPGSSYEFEIPDRRNQQRLLDIFKRDNKLK